MLLPLQLNGLNLDSATVVAVVTGTIGDGASETEVAAGGTIIVTLTNDEWVADDGTFAAQRQSIIDGLDSDGSELNGWNNTVRDALDVSAVVRTSDTVVTITVPPTATYDIVSDETVTVTVPADALVTTSGDLTAFPTISISAVSAQAQGSFGGDAPVRSRKKRRIDEFKARIEQMVDEAIADEVPAAVEVEAEAPPKVTKSVQKKITRRIVTQIADSSEFVGKIDALSKMAETLVNESMARRRIERRRLLTLRTKQLQMQRMREEAAIIAIIMLLEAE